MRVLNHRAGRSLEQVSLFLTPYLCAAAALKNVTNMAALAESDGSWQLFSNVQGHKLCRGKDGERESLALMQISETVSSSSSHQLLLEGKHTNLVS